MVIYVWNNIAVYPYEGSYISRTAMLEGHTRQFDLSVLRAFGTECYWMLTLQKKHGRKGAMYPKANAGVLVGIEDNMPAYRIYDLTQQGIIRKIPFAQTVTHEGHFPEWLKYGFGEEEEKELSNVAQPEMQELNRASNIVDEEAKHQNVPPRTAMPSSATEAQPLNASASTSSSTSSSPTINHN